MDKNPPWLVVEEHGAHTTFVTSDDVQMFEINWEQASTDPEYARAKLLELAKCEYLPAGISTGTAEVIKEQLWMTKVDSEEQRESLRLAGLSYSLPELMGMSEVMEVTDRSRGSILALMEDEAGDFPQPLSRLRCGPVWDGVSVRRWAFRNPKRTAKPLTPETRAAILTELAEGGSPTRIAEKYGIATGTVHAVRRAAASNDEG